MRVESSNFEEVRQVWARELWPGRKSPIESNSAMKWRGGLEMELMNVPASFWVIRENVAVIAVLSGHFGGLIPDPEANTSGDSPISILRSYRTRGLWVHPSSRNRGAAIALMKAALLQADEESCNVLWTFPRQSSMPAYEKFGFKMAGGWIGADAPGAGEFGPNCYAYLKLRS